MFLSLYDCSSCFEMVSNANMWKPMNEKTIECNSIDSNYIKMEPTYEVNYIAAAAIPSHCQWQTIWKLYSFTYCKHKRKWNSLLFYIKKAVVKTEKSSTHKLTRRKLCRFFYWTAGCIPQLGGYVSNVFRNELRKVHVAKMECWNTFFEIVRNFAAQYTTPHLSLLLSELNRVCLTSTACKFASFGQLNITKTLLNMNMRL